MNIEQELSRLSIGLISEPKVAVTRTMMAQVLAFIQSQAEAYARELVQRPDQVAGDFVAAIVRAYLCGLPDNEGDTSSERAAAFARSRAYDTEGDPT